MASTRPKSPRTPISTKKEDKESSFWDKIGTLGRKKRIKEGTFRHNMTLHGAKYFSNDKKTLMIIIISLFQYKMYRKKENMLSIHPALLPILICHQKNML